MDNQGGMAHEYMSAGEKKLAEGPILPLFARFAIPGVIGFLFLGMQVLVDGILLGRFVGANALASVSIIFPAYGVLIALSIVFNIGCQCLMGIKLGERNAAQANQAFFTAFILVVISMTLWSAAAFFFSAEIASLLGANDVLIEDSSTYLRIMAFSSPSCIVFLCNGALKAQGRPFLSLLAMAIMVLSNVFLDILFIYVFKWGVPGAAWATVMATFIGLVISFPIFLRKKSRVNLWFGNFRKDFAFLITYNGSSEGISEFSAHISALLFNLTMMNYLGEKGVAAFSVIGYMAFVSVAFFIGLVDGTRSIISFNYGQKSRDRIVATLAISAQTIILIGFMFFIGMLYFGSDIVPLFLSKKDSDVAKIAIYGATIYSFTFLVQGFNILASGYFTAIGNAKLSMIISLLKGLVFIIIGLAVLPKIFGINGIWLTVPVAEYLTLGVSAYLMIRAMKQLGGDLNK